MRVLFGNEAVHNEMFVLSKNRFKEFFRRVTFILKLKKKCLLSFQKKIEILVRRRVCLIL